MLRNSSAMFFARKKRDAALKDTIDRLGAVRDALRVLRVREEALVQELEQYRPADYVRAGAYELERRQTTLRRFDRFALPAHIRNDDAYWKSETRQTLVLTPLDSTQKTPSAEQIADTYAETHDLPVGLSAEEADYGKPAMPRDLPDAAVPLAGIDAPTVAEASADAGLLQERAAAEPAAGFDFSGVPRYRTGGKARREC